MDYELLRQYAVDNGDNIFEAIAIGGTVLLFYLVVFFFRRYRRLLRRLWAWEKTMTGSQRAEYLDRLVEDGLTDLIEEWLRTGKISPQEQSKLYRRYYEQTGLPGLKARKLKLKKKDQVELKNKIRSRIDNVDEKLKELPSREVSVRGMKDRMLKAVKAA